MTSHYATPPRPPSSQKPAPSDAVVRLEPRPVRREVVALSRSLDFRKIEPYDENPGAGAIFVA